MVKKKQKKEARKKEKKQPIEKKKPAEKKEAKIEEAKAEAPKAEEQKPEEKKPEKRGFFQMLQKKENKKPAESVAPPADEEAEKAEPEKKKKFKTIGDQLRAEGLIQEPERGEEEATTEKEAGLSELIVRIDKIEGKLEMTKEMTDAMNERISEINEKIGDLRRMGLDSERSLTDLSADFERVQVTVKELEPEKLVRDLEKFEGELSKEEAKVEKAEISVENFSQRLKKIEDEFAKIKSFENLVGVMKKINEKTAAVEDSRRYADRMASKVESIFSEVNEKVIGLNKEIQTIEKVDELSTKMVKDLADLQFKFNEKALKKEDLDSIKEVIVQEAEKINPAVFESLKQKVLLIEMDLKSRSELEAEKSQLIHLIETSKEDYTKKKISVTSYDELRLACEKKLQEINTSLERKKIKHAGKAEVQENIAAAKTAISAKKGPKTEKEKHAVISQLKQATTPRIKKRERKESKEKLTKKKQAPIKAIKKKKPEYKTKEEISPVKREAEQTIKQFIEEREKENFLDKFRKALEGEEPKKEEQSQPQLIKSEQKAEEQKPETSEDDKGNISKNKEELPTNSQDEENKTEPKPVEQQPEKEEDSQENKEVNSSEKDSQQRAQVQNNNNESSNKDVPTPGESQNKESFFAKLKKSLYSGNQKN